MKTAFHVPRETLLREPAFAWGSMGVHAANCLDIINPALTQQQCVDVVRALRAKVGTATDLHLGCMAEWNGRSLVDPYDAPARDALSRNCVWFGQAAREYGCASVSFDVETIKLDGWRHWPEVAGQVGLGREMRMALQGVSEMQLGIMCPWYDVAHFPGFLAWLGGYGLPCVIWQESYADPRGSLYTPPRGNLPRRPDPVDGYRERAAELRGHGLTVWNGLAVDVKPNLARRLKPSWAMATKATQGALWLFPWEWGPEMALWPVANPTKYRNVRQIAGLP